MASHASQLRIVASRPLLKRTEGPFATGAPESPVVRRFVPHSPRYQSGRTRALRIGRFVLRGGGPLHELPLIDVSRERTCLMFPRGTHPAVGDIFEIVRPIRIRDDFARSPGGPRRVVALVKVIGLERETRAFVHVLGGSVIKGYWAEKIEEDRLADFLHPSLNVLDFFSILRPKPQARR